MPTTTICMHWKMLVSRECLTVSMMQHADPSRLDNFALFVLGSYDPSDRHSFYRLIVTDNPKPCFCPTTTGAPG